MNKMKKLFLVLVALISIVALAACSNDSGKTKIGILQLAEHDSLNTITSAVKEKLNNLGYTEENTEIIFKNGNGDVTQMAQIIADFIEKDVDIVVAVATGAAQAAVTAAVAHIPVIFAAVSDPVGSGLIDNDEKPTGNITGVSDRIHVSETLAHALEIKPFTKMGFIYTKAEASASKTVARAKAYLTTNDIGYAERIITKWEDDLEIAFNALIAEGCNAFYLPDDNLLATKGPIGIYSALCIEEGYPLYAAADSEVCDGALFCAGITYPDLGARVAEMVDCVLKGTAIEDIPVDYMESPVYYYVNKMTQEALGITLPDSVKNHENFVYVTESK